MDNKFFGIRFDFTTLAALSTCFALALTIIFHIPSILLQARHYYALRSNFQIDHGLLHVYYHLQSRIAEVYLNTNECMLLSFELAKYGHMHSHNLQEKYASPLS
jgi:hypothetical protein